MKLTKFFFTGVTITVVITFLFVSTNEFISDTGQEKVLTDRFRKPVLTGHEGELIPSFEILLPDSLTLVDVSTTEVGKSAVLFYFGPDCPNCQREISEILDKGRKMANIHFYILTPYPFSEMRRFYEKFELAKYPNVTTGYDYKFFFDGYFKIRSVPCIAIYNRDRRLKGVFVGRVGYEQIIYLAGK